MKKQFFLSIIIFASGLATVKAQSNSGGGFQHMTVQQRVDNVMSKLGELNLDSATTIKADTIFTDFYTQQQQMMQAIMQSGGDQSDREAMRTKRQQFADDRDNKLKTIFTADQYTKWKSDIEPSLRPQRGGMRSSQQQ